MTDCTELRTTLRRLWLEHVLWTRLVIISTFANLPDLAVVTARLLQNQTDIGAALRPFIGPAAADQLVMLLREHITGAAAVLAAAKANLVPTQATGIALGTAVTSWYANAERISDFLAAAGLGDYRVMMRSHLDQTMGEATARLQGNWQADVDMYDRAEAHILMLADALASAVCRPAAPKFSLGQALITGSLGALGGWWAAKSAPRGNATPHTEDFTALRADARAVRRWSNAHKADGWSYQKLVSALTAAPEFSSWNRDRLDSAIEEDADTAR